MNKSRRGSQSSLTMGSGTQGNYTPTKRRGPIAAEFQGPGPATIALPTTIGHNAQESTVKKAPAFSFGARHEEKLDTPGPGPGQYNVTKLNHKGKDEHPAPTLSGRPKDPKKEATPAPGAYSPEKGEKVVGEQTPAYSFGTKLKNDKPENIPAPNSYSLPPAIGTGVAPAFSISGKGKTTPPPLLPGPGQYDTSSPDKYKQKSPAYSLSSRTHLPSDSTQKPGPGAHSPEKVQVDSRKSYSFGVKHSPYLGSLKAH